ncbi:NADPH-dependent FMN reductase [uncultured Mameliella sp.]|uniref:NADPH-dependent FMN reductase n=1 Tax=uncultured Mameliella sp. TaxID=1447087 RepID=UPI00260FA2D5|nr:NADPH-dependent FMN reductase [uncultured Mameliella sp.]
MSAQKGAPWHIMAGSRADIAVVEGEGNALYPKLMEFLAISGSARTLSTNTAMLHAVSDIARPEHRISVFDRIGDLPVFSPDLETDPLPDPVRIFIDLIRTSDALIIASPEYVRAIPGGLKNAIDWLVSRDEIIDKPIALMHGAHRGDDMLAQLRTVLSTVSTRFSNDLFLRFELMKKSPAEIEQQLALPERRQEIDDFLRRFAEFCGQ